MDHHEAAQRLDEVQRVRRMSARSGAWTATIITSAAVLAIGVVADLDVWWISGLVVLGLVGIWAARPLRSRFDWTNRSGARLLTGGGILAGAAYVGAQFPARAAEWPIPNTVGALAAIVVIVLVCRVGMQRMAIAASTGAAGPR